MTEAASPGILALARRAIELAEKATPGPWQAVPNTSNGWEVRAAAPGFPLGGAVELAGGDARSRLIPVCIEAWSRFTSLEYDEMVAANFQLIAMLPALARGIEALTRERDQAKRYAEDAPVEIAKLILRAASAEARLSEVERQLAEAHNDWTNACAMKGACSLSAALERRSRQRSEPTTGSG